MNIIIIIIIIIRFTKFRLTLYRALRFQSTAVVMADQNLLDAINIDEKNLLDTINIEEDTPERITQETPVPTKKIEKNKESESTISDIEDYINEKYDELAFCFKKGTTTRNTLVNPKIRK